MQTARDFFDMTMTPTSDAGRHEARHVCVPERPEHVLCHLLGLLRTHRVPDADCYRQCREAREAAQRVRGDRARALLKVKERQNRTMKSYNKLAGKRERYSCIFKRKKM